MLTPSITCKKVEIWVWLVHGKLESDSSAIKHSNPADSLKLEIDLTRA